MCCLSTAWEDENKEFPTALACVCGMKHFPTGVGLVLHLQVGDTFELDYHNGKDGTTCYWSHSPTPLQCQSGAGLL